MKKFIEDVGVDAGMIMISDKNYYDKYESKIDTRLSRIRKMKPGIYKVNWRIVKTWNGSIDGDGILKIKSGEMVVSDPCYCVGNNKWDKWLEDTEFGKYEPDGCIILSSMGGDGNYNINLDMRLMDEI